MALDFGLGKAIAKTAAKGFAKEALPVIGKEVAEQTFKTLDVTAKEALGNLGRNKSYQNLAFESQDAFIKHIESLPVKDIPPEAEAIDSMFKRMDSTDPEIQNIGNGQFNEVDQGLRGINNARREAQRLLAKKGEVSGKPPLPPQPEPPPVHNITKADEATWMKEVLAPFIQKNEAEIRNNKLFTNQNIGEIIEDNQLKRVSTSSIEDFLSDDLRDIKKLKLKGSNKGKPNQRAIVADPVNSPEAIQTLKTANDAWVQGQKTPSGKRAGVNPQWLNPETFRAGQMRGANFARTLIRKIRKIPGFENFDVQQGHPIDLIKSRGVDAMAAFGAETGKANRYWNRKHVGGTIMSSEAMEEIGQAGAGKLKEAAAITSEGPLALQRKAEYEQFAVLQEIWNQALLAMETKGKSMKDGIALITKHRNAIQKGEYAALRSDFKLPGSLITLDDMLAIQIQSLKLGNPEEAAQKVLAERYAFEWAKANGLAETKDTLEILRKSMKYINTMIDVEDAKAAGPQTFEYSGRDINKQGIEGFPEGRRQTLPKGAAQPVDWSGI